MRSKPGITARLRAAKRRKELAHARKVRELVAARDGHCRYGADIPAFHRGGCSSHPEWAHFGDLKRFKTRGKSPEERHATAGSMMLCRRHHWEYDHGLLEVVALTEAGCDGPLEWS